MHQHTDACHDENGTIICGQADYVLHTHDQTCYDANHALICQLPEITEHVHSDACYLIEQLHTHDDSCFLLEYAVPQCGQAAGEAHQHTIGCFAEGTLDCTAPATHTHGNECYAGGQSVCLRIRACP